MSYALSCWKILKKKKYPITNRDPIINHILIYLMDLRVMYKIIFRSIILKWIFLLIDLMHVTWVISTCIIRFCTEELGTSIIVSAWIAPVLQRYNFFDYFHFYVYILFQHAVFYVDVSIKSVEIELRTTHKKTNLISIPSHHNGICSHNKCCTCISE